MKPLKTCTTILFLFFATTAFSQIEIIGDMRFGDTTQTHVLNTVAGDRMIGRVTGFDEKEIRFLFLGKTLTFPLSEVKSIEVKTDNDQPPALTTGDLDKEAQAAQINDQKVFLYQVLMKDSTRHEAFLQSFAAGKFTFTTKENEGLELGLAQIDIMVLLNQPLANDGQLLISNQIHEFKGVFTKLVGGEISFVTLRGSELTFKTNTVTAIETRPKQAGPGSDMAIVKAGPKPFLRNFIAPTGFTLRKGESEYRNTQIFFNTLDHGLADHVTVGVGLMTVFTANVISGRVKLGAKLGDNLHVAAGGQAGFGFAFGVSDNFSFYNYCGAFTIGSYSHNVTGSLGRLRTSDDDENINQFSLAGSFQTGKKGRIFVELIHLRDNNDFNRSTFINLGGSWFKNNDRIDFGLSLIGVEGEVIVPFPFAAYSHFF